MREIVITLPKKNIIPFGYKAGDWGKKETHLVRIPTKCLINQGRDAVVKVHVGESEYVSELGKLYCHVVSVYKDDQWKLVEFLEFPSNLFKSVVEFQLP